MAPQLDPLPNSLERFLRRVPRPQLKVGLEAGRITVTLLSLDQTEVFEAYVDGDTVCEFTPARGDRA